MTVTAFQQANQLLREGKLEEAVVAYQQAIAQNGKFYWTYHNLGETLLKMGRLDEAVEAYGKAIELNPSATCSYFNLGQVLEQCSKSEEAVICYEKALELQPKLAILQEKLEDLKEKSQLLMNHLDPHDDSQGGTAQAKNSTNKIVSLMQQTPESYFYQGQQLVAEGKWEEAILYYRLAIELTSTLPHLHYYLGSALAQLQRWREALSEYKKFLEYNLPFLSKVKVKPFQDVEVYFYPDYRSTNPYQTLLYSNPPQNTTIKAGSLDVALQAVKNNSTFEKVIFHLHWTSFILASARSAEDAEILKDQFLVKLYQFSSEGGVLVWTIHNILPHECRYPKQEIELRTVLSSLAAKIHIHSEKSIPEITEYFPINLEKVQILPLGNYINCYSNYVDRTVARQRFGLKDEDIVFLFTGQIRGYKGIDDLLRAYLEIYKQCSSVHLIIAGSPVAPLKKGMISSKTKIFSNLTVLEEYIPDDQLQWLYNAADIVVLPYRKILTSSSVLTALSFKRPVIAPTVGMIEEIVQDGYNGFLYEIGDISSLMKAMLKVTEIDLTERKTLFHQSFESIKKLTWESHAKNLFSNLKFPALELSLQPLFKTQQLQWNSKQKYEQDAQGEHPILEDIDLQVESELVECKIFNPLSQKANGINQVAIIILNYNCLADTINLVDSLKCSTYQNFTLIIVDNNSVHFNYANFKKNLRNQTLILSPKNLGYAGGNNLGIQYVKDKGFEFIWILNPDTIVENYTLENLVVAAQEDRKFSVYGSAIFWKDRPNNVWYGGGIIQSENQNFKTYHMYENLPKNLLPNNIYEVDYVTGASLFCRLNLFEEVGLIPEQYFLYFEETDWCMKVRQAGHKLAVVPSSHLYHAKRSQLGVLPTKTYFYYYIRSSILFITQYFPEKKLLLNSGIESNFIQPWLNKIEAKTPQHLAYFTALAEKALEDGCNGVTGYIDLSQVLAVKDKNYQLNFKQGRKIQGCIETIDQTKIRGWAYNKSQPIERLKISILIDSKFYVATWADQYREDIKLQGYGDGYYGFEVQMPAYVYDSNPHKIEAWVEDSVLLKSLIPVPFQSFHQTPEYKGRIDGMENRYIRGWTLNLNNPHEILTVEILDSTTVILETECNKERPDLLRAGYPTSLAGFTSPIPLAYCDGQKHLLTLRVKGTDNIIFNCAVMMSTEPYPLLTSSDQEDIFAWLFYYREISMVYEIHRNLDFLRQLEANTLLLSKQFSNRPQENLVSVIMATYNRNETIRISMESVVSQTYTNWELIIIDDGSTDNTVEVVQEFIEQHRDRKITLIQQKSNQGVSKARNQGLNTARGKICAYLDSDNTWEPDFLMIMVNSLIDSPQCKSAYCGDKIWQHYQGKLAFNSSPEIVLIRLGHFNRSLLENRNYIDLNVFVHWQELYCELGGFREDMRRLVDWELIVRYTDLAPPQFVPALLANYNMDLCPNQITHKENFDDNMNKMKQTLAQLVKTINQPANLAKSPSSSPVSRTIVHPVQIVVLGDNKVNFDSLTLCLQAILANTDRDRSRILLYLNDEEKELGQKIEQYFTPIKNLQINFGNKVQYSQAIVNLKKQLTPQNSLILLNYDAIVSSGWLEAFEEVAKLDESAGILISRQIMAGTNPLAQQLVPYAHSLCDIDIALSPQEISICKFHKQASLNSVELLNFKMFCTYLSPQLLIHLDTEQLRGMDEQTLVQYLGQISSEKNQKILYTPKARVFHTSYFQ
jgi:GT2 family glycosyltransferase/glycosyltransferase involved in cell wall biosynthesis